MDVAVIVTVKNDLRVLACVDAILRQEAPFPFDVVVVDNGSTDETRSALRRRYQADRRVHLLESGGNLSHAWNTAANSVNAKILVRLDADTLPLPGWLVAITAPLIMGSADWAAGPVGAANSESSFVAKYYDQRTEAYSRRLARDSVLRDAVPSWNVAYQRSALDRAGWYDAWQASSVDWDLHKRLARFAARGKFVPEAKVLHHHPSTLRELVRKEAWYRTGQYQMVLKYGIREMIGAFLLPGAYVLVVVLALVGFVWSLSWWLALALLVALVVKHWIEGRREGDPMWLARPLFRPIEAFAGAFGLARGFLRYGIHAVPRFQPEPSKDVRGKP